VAASIFHISADQSAIANLLDFDKALVRATRDSLALEGGHYVQRVVREHTSRVGAIARGDFWRDWDYKVRPKARGADLEVFNRQPEVVTAVVEGGRAKQQQVTVTKQPKGRRADGKPRKARTYTFFKNPPPSDAMLELMKVHGIRPGPGQTEGSVAYLIGQKISRDGIPGRYPVSAAAAEVESGTELERIVGGYVTRAIKRL